MSTQVARLNTLGLPNVLMLRAALWGRRASVRLSGQTMGEWAWRVADDVPMHAGRGLHDVRRDAMHAGRGLLQVRRGVEEERLPSLTMDDLLGMSCAKEMPISPREVPISPKKIAISPAEMPMIDFLKCDIEGGESRVG